MNLISKYHLVDAILLLLKDIPCEIIFNSSDMKSLMQIMYDKAKSSHLEVFLKILQNSQESTAAWVSFLMKFLAEAWMKLLVEACSFIEMETPAQMFFCDFANFLEHLFHRTTLVAGTTKPIKIF